MLSPSPPTTSFSCSSQAVICLRLIRDFMVNQLPTSWVTLNMEVKATRFLKRWDALARSSDTLRLYLPKADGDLGLPAISTVYQKQQTTVANLIITSSDPIIQHTATLTMRREKYLTRPPHTTILKVREILQTDPSASRKSPIKKAKAHVATCKTEKGLAAF